MPDWAKYNSPLSIPASPPEHRRMGAASHKAVSTTSAARPAPERVEMEQRLLLDGAGQREPGKRSSVSLTQVPPWTIGGCASARPWIIRSSVTSAFQLAMAHPVVDRLELAQHGRDAAALVPGSKSGPRCAGSSPCRRRSPPPVRSRGTVHPGAGAAGPRAGLSGSAGRLGRWAVAADPRHCHPDGPRPPART